MACATPITPASATPHAYVPSKSAGDGDGDGAEQDRHSKGDESGIYVECDARRDMDKLFLERIGICTAGDGDGRVGVTETMDAHALALHTRVAYAGIPDARPPAVVMDASAAFSSEQELVLALSGGRAMVLASPFLGRYEPHHAFSAIGPCAADAGFAVSEVETLNLQGERFV